MKLFLFSTFLILASCQFAAAQYEVVKCDSGNCVTGRGNAQVKFKRKKVDFHYTYKGMFADGKPEGEGVLIADKYYAGTFKKGKKKGLGVEFAYGNGFIPYYGFTFRNHDNEDNYDELYFNVDGKATSNHIETGYYTKYGNPDVKDKILLAFADEFLTKHGYKTFSQQFKEAQDVKTKAEDDYKNNISAVTDLQLPMGSWVECYNKEFKQGRAYYPTYDYPGRKIAPAMSMFNYQILGPDGKVLRAGEDNWGSNYKFVAPSTGVYKVLMQYKQITAGLPNSYIMPTARVVVTVRYTDPK